MKTEGGGARRFARPDRWGTIGEYGVGIKLSHNGTEHFLRLELARELLVELEAAILESEKLRREGGGKG